MLEDAHAGSLARVWFECLLPDEGELAFSTPAIGALPALSELAGKLAQSWGWHPAETALFVLTGAPPPYNTMSASINLRRTPDTLSARITLEIDPILMPKDVAAFYRRLRRQLLRERKTNPLSERAMRAALFVAEQPHQSISDSWKAWNRRHPDQAYDRYRDFWRAQASTRRKLLQPAIRLPATVGHQPTTDRA